MSGKVFGFVLGAALGLAVIPAIAASSVPVPQVTGPIASPDVPGTPTHNYTFFASNHDLASHGYVEEEYFVKGTASTYNTPEGQTGTVKQSGIPYYTRIVVRRPVNPRVFNGSVLVEWDNVTNLFDAENVWFFDWEDMMRSGYVWVGVTNQTIGVAALKKFSPKRYGALDVGKSLPSFGPPAAGAPRVDADAESYDIMSQVAAALRHPGASDPLHGLKPKVILAVGESQSAGRLSTYINSVNPLTRVYDGFLLLSSETPIRTDIPVPVFKVSTEHDIVTSGAPTRQPDTAKFVAWEVAGTSHVDQHLRASREPLELRDNGVSLEANMSPLCAIPEVGTRVPTTYVLAAAFGYLSKWAAGGAPPPSSPKLDITQVVKERGKQSIIARNKDGLAEGGIQLSQQAVPIQINIGVGAPAHPATGRSGEAIGAGACVRWGSSVDMTVAQLNAHYASHADYVAKVRAVTEANLAKGFILKPDADATIKAAEASQVGDH